MTTLADEIIAQHIDIGRYSASVQQRILVLLEKMRIELTAKLATEDLTAFGKMRTEALLRQATAIIEAHYAQIAVVVKSSTEAIVPLTARHAATALGASVTVQLGIGLPTATVLERLVSNVIIQGSPLEGWWAKQAADTAFRFSNAVRIGIAAGETNAQIITRLVGRPRLGIPGVMDITRKNAAALVQTATATVANAARAETFKSNADVTPRVAWLATLDNLTCAECGVRDGLEWMNDKDHKPVGHKIPYSTPALHPNCLPGDAVVSSCGAVKASSKRWYDGQMIVVRTASGNEIVCTPNHPILTGRGFIPARLLDERSKVISARKRIVGSLDDDGQYMVSSIKQIAESFGGVGQMLSTKVPTTSMDFHGDASNGVEQIAIIRADRELLNHVDAACRQSFMHFSFKWADAKRLILIRTRTLRQSFQGVFTAATCNLSVMRLRCALFLRHLRPFEVFRFGLIPVRDASVQQSQGNNVTRYAESFGDFIFGHAGKVFVDDVISIERKSFHGFVFNLETETGYYIANGIVTHNCRCVMVGVTRGEFFDVPVGRRASMDGPVGGKTTFTDWIGRRTEAQIAEQFGAGRAELFKKGTITFEQFLSPRGNVLSLSQLKAKYK